MKIQFLCILSIISISSGYKILFLVPFPGPSHWIILQNFAKELLNRGHDVTAIVNKPISNFNSTKYTEILIDPPFDVSTIFSMKDAFGRTELNDFERVVSYEILCRLSSEHGLKNRYVQEIIHSKNLHFDLVINEEMFHESWLMFAYKFNAPIVTISTYGYSDFFDRSMGLLTPISHVGHMLLPYGDDMTYSQRVYNTLLTIFDYFHRNWVAIPRQNKLAQRYFDHLAEPGKSLPSVDEMHRNSHRSTSKPRPLMPGIVYVGGAHIKLPNPLPIKLQEFIDGAKEGVIFFSLGSFLESSKMSKDKINIFLEAFGKLKQRVIWKFEDSSTSVPPNVLVDKWLPQSDILAHPKVKLFITHGGMSGTFEGTARGVPMLFIPIFGDQLRNAMKSESTGNALILPFSDISVNSLFAMLEKMLSDSTFSEHAKELAELFNDNLVHPMDEAMFWIEYVMRTNGAKHLKSFAVNMTSYSYLLMDIFLVPIFVILLIYIIMKILRQISWSKKKQNQTSNKKQK